MEFALADIAASAEVVDPAAVPVGKAKVLVLPSGYGAEVELNELPFMEKTVVMDVLVVKEMYMLVTTDTDSVVPTPPIRVESIPFESEEGLGVRDIETVPVGPGAKVTLDNERGAESGPVRLLVSLVLTRDPVSLVLEFVPLVEFPEGREGKSKLRLDPLVTDVKFLVNKGAVVDDSEVVKNETVSKAEIAAEALVENVFIRVKFVESAAVPFRLPAVVNVMLAGADGALRTSFVEVVVLMASVVTTETKVFVSSASEDVWSLLDDLWALELDIVSWPIELVLALGVYPLSELVWPENKLSPCMGELVEYSEETVVVS